MTSKWAVTVHNGGGSMAEAVDPIAAFLFDNEQDAEAASNALNAIFAQQPHHSDETWATYYSLERLTSYNLPGATPEQLAELAKAGRQPEPGMVAIDLTALGEAILDDSLDELLLPDGKTMLDVVKAEQEDEAAVIASIMGETTLGMPQAEFDRTFKGTAPVQVGKCYEHPEDGPIKVFTGTYLDATYGRVSNWWSWRVLATGETKSGYAGPWPELDEDEIEEEPDGAPCCPDPGCGGHPCTFPGYASNH